MGVEHSRVILSLLLIVVVLFGIKWQQNLAKFYQTDFAAYWSAGRAVNQGVDRYSYLPIDTEGLEFKHAMFLNPPVVAHLFRPLGSVSFHTAKTIWYYVQLGLFAVTIILLARSWLERSVYLVLTVVGMPFIFWPLWAELERGETNMISLISVAISYVWWRRGNYIGAGLALGFGSAFKFPLLLGFVVPAVLKQWRLIMAGGLMFVCVFSWSLFVDGVELNRVYFMEYLPGISRQDHLPADVFRVDKTPKPPITRWEGVTYMTRYPFQAPSGSATRFWRDWLDYKLDRSLVLGGAIVTAGAVLIGARRNRILKASRAKRELWEDMAWSAVVMATLILHTLSWITNYVLAIFPIILLWRMVLSRASSKMGNLARLGLLLGVFAIVVGDPITTVLPSVHFVVDIILRNRVWLGGTLVWGLLLVLLMSSKFTGLSSSRR